MYGFVCVHTYVHTWIFIQIDTALVAVLGIPGPRDCPQARRSKALPLGLASVLTPVCAGSFAHSCGVLRILQIRRF